MTAQFPEQVLNPSGPGAAVTFTARRLADPGEQQWRRVTIQLWGEALRDERVMQIARSGLDEPIEIIAGPPRMT